MTDNGAVSFLLRVRDRGVDGTVTIVDSFVDDFRRRVLVTAAGHHFVRSSDGRSLVTWQAHPQVPSDRIRKI